LPTSSVIVSLVCTPSVPGSAELLDHLSAGLQTRGCWFLDT
jgi:hypothetical protein